MSNQIAVFDDGIVQQLAPPDELYEKPVNAFVAGFIGENNRLYGTVKEISGDFCQVELEGGGGMVKALSVNNGGVGSRTTLSLRPERVTIGAIEGQTENALEAKVEELIYLGDHIRSRVKLSGNDEFVVKVPNSHGHVHLKEGEITQIGWEAEDCRALDG